MENSNLKEYTRVGFGIDAKKNSFQTTTKNGKEIFKQIKLDFRHPSAFTYRNHLEIKGDVLKLFFKGGSAGDSNEDLIESSNSEITAAVKENVEHLDIPVGKNLKILYVRDQWEDGSSFLPDSTGGGILVGI